MQLGYSLPVENVQELASDNTKEVPARYIRPELEISSTDHEESWSRSIPVIDMYKLTNHDESELKMLDDACKEWGFFQLMNHGSEEIIEKMKRVIGEFFKLPLKEKMVYRMPENGLEGYGQHFVKSKDQKLDWCDLFFLRVLPIDARDINFWPNTPSSFRFIVEEYSNEMNNIFNELLKMMSTNLGSVDCVDDALNVLCKDGVQHMRMNYYPPCKQSDKVIGLTPHSDACMLTLLIQANNVQGLQIKNANKWVPVKPLQGSIIVNIGDVMEIVSNGIYKSVEHRALVDIEKERLSIAAFHSPSASTTIGPLAHLVTDNGSVKYKTLQFKELLKISFESKLDGKSLLSHVKFDN